MRRTLLIMTLLAAAAPALAEDHPLLRPTRDVAVEYRSSGAQQGPAAQTDHIVTMRFASSNGKVRIDGPNGRGYAILDLDAGQMTMVMADQKMYVERPADPGMLGMFRGTNTTLTRSGSDTVAGVSCTTYNATINERTGQVCLTDDGVLLRARSKDADRQHELEATKVSYGAQPAALFEIPTGYQKLDASNMPRGLPMGPPGSYPGRPPGAPPGPPPGLAPGR